MTYKRTVVAAFAAASISLLVGAVPGLAQDPPSRVGRLNWLEGAVSFQPAGLDTWTNATLNYPLTTGDHIYTDRDSRAEMHVGPNAIRLSPLSNFGYLNLDDRTVQIRFTEGSLEVRVRDLADGDLYEVDTPQGAITLLRTGDYRIDCDPDRNATMVTVRAGDAEITANGQAFAIHPRQTAFFSGDNPPDIREANPPDAFDAFTNDRNRLEERPRPHEYVPSTMAGSEDLYTYGQWRVYPGYGSVWLPPVPAGWAPYQFGHWAWVEPWGWTWVDAAPWGFAPFHYGRWAHVDVGWIWIPGPVRVRPVYAPALVVFVGGPRFGTSLGFGAGVAWFALGPREIYRPAYHVSNTYVNRVNVTNVTNVNVTNINVTNVNVNNVRYVNQTVPGAVTAVPQNAFVSRQPVHQAMRQVTPQQMAQAQVIGTAPPVAPQRASLAGVGRENVPRPQEALMQRQVVAKQTPPLAPVAFQARQQALSQNPGRPVDPQAIRQIQMQQSSPQTVERVRPANVPRARPLIAQPAAPQAIPQPVAPQPVAPQPKAPQPVAPQPAMRQTPPPAPVPQQRPAERMDSRPPSVARPVPERTAPVPQSAPAPRPPVQSPARPAERGRPIQRAEPRPAAPAEQHQRDGRREVRKEDTKDEKKEDRRERPKQ